MKRQSKQVIVIGSGVAGLAVAIRLALQGRAVTVYEKNAYPGGKLTQRKMGAYTFDAGPSLFTLPHLLIDLFLAAGLRAADYFEFEEVPEAFYYHFSDGSSFYTHKDERLFRQRLSALFSEKEVAAFFKHLSRAKLRYEATAPLFLERSLHEWRTYFSKAVLPAIAKVPKLGLFGRMHGENESLFQDKRLQQYFDRFATYNGSDPYEAPALLNLIPHLEHGYGTFYPKKGMHQITEALFALAQKCGVQFEFNKAVKRVLIRDGQAVGIRLMDEQEISSDLVVCNADIRFAYKYLIPEIPAPKAFDRLASSSSAIIFYWGVKQKFPALRLHNLFFSADYKSEFEAIFNGKGYSDDPTIYINIGSKQVISDAPADGENWFVMVNVAADKGQNWEEIRQHVRATVIKKMSAILQQDIASLIEEEDFLDPPRIEQRTASIGGGLYGHASNERMAAFWRQANKSNRLKNLYFCGGSVHPGGGIPLCLNSAKITSELIAKYED